MSHLKLNISVSTWKDQAKDLKRWNETVIAAAKKFSDSKQQLLIEKSLKFKEKEKEKQKNSRPLLSLPSPRLRPGSLPPSWVTSLHRQ
jgi:16S rRNA U1498 N3-methylase RsmE